MTVKSSNYIGENIGERTMTSDRPINHPVNFYTHQSGQRDRVAQLFLKVIQREIESRLNQALHHRIYLRTLDRKTQFREIDIPWAIHQTNGDRPEVNLSEYTNIEAVFAHKEIQGRLGICGVPGSGKTTLVLKLAQGLVNQAMHNPESPLPILLDVSSWQNNQQAIAPWIISILQIKYHLDRQTAKQLLKPHQVILLCDGLDELDETNQNKFISNLNKFLLDYWSGKIVIIGGITPHLMQLFIVNIQTYIELLPLTNNSVDRYLVQNDCEYLREAIQADANLLQISQIPLFLNLIILSATEINLSEWQLGKNRAEKLSYLWDAYIRNGLKDRGYFSHTSKENRDKNIVRWFSWLAQKSLKHHQP
jgi:GTPase SAR1 family protein